MPGYALSVLPQHQRLLEASAISSEVARQRGYVSADSKKQLERYGFAGYQQRSPALVIPLHRADGSIWGYQARPDNARQTTAGNTVKYETPAGQKNDVDIPPGIRDVIGDPAVPLFVTEGSRKADSAVSHGVACVSLNGVSGSRRTNGNGGKVMAPGWLDIALNGRRVVMAFDSDATRKLPVQAELRKLGSYLESKGARIEYLHLPDGDDAGKTGLDDYLKGNGADDLWSLVRPELPPLIIVSTPTPRETAHTRTPAADQPEQVCAVDGVCAHTPDLAKLPDLLAEAVGAVHDLGVTGEDRIIRGTFLTALSQVLPEPVSLVVKGSSAGGKSYSTKTTLRLFPDADFYTVTAGSQRSLIYTDEDFKQRTIVMYEATALREVAEQRDGDMTAMLVRTLLSEGQIVYDVTERGDDGKMAARRIVKSGPTNLIVTTTADNLHHENETRLLSLTVDESEDQTRAVMRKIALRRNQTELPEPLDLEPWHALFHWLKHHAVHRVYIPYAGYLAEAAAASAIRMRRDFSVLLGMIEAHAVLHQASRGRDAHARIVADDTDYHAARNVLAEAFAVTSGRKVKDSVRRAVMAVDELGGEMSDVLVAQIAKHLKRDRTRVNRLLNEAADLGYLTNREDKAGRPARYRLGPDKLPDDQAALPDVLPDDIESERTPAQVAHLSPQVTDGCAGVRVCTGCGESLHQSFIDAGFTDHGNCSPNDKSPTETP